MERRKEIFIKMENLSEIMDLMKEIKVKEEEIHGHFDKLAQVKSEEDKVFKGWGDNAEELLSKLDNIVM
jgi:hypothetical protein